MQAETKHHHFSSKGPESRIGWGALFAGLFSAFVLTLLLESIGIAVGLTGDGTLGTGTAIWSVIVALLSLFVGGWVMARMETAQLNNADLAIHGLTLWGVLFFSLLFLAANGIQMGLSGILGAASTMGDIRGILDLQSLANQLNLDDEQIRILQEWAQSTPPNAAQTAWWGVLGLVVSLAAVIIGAMLGQPKRLRRQEMAAADREKGAA